VQGCFFRSVTGALLPELGQFVTRVVDLPDTRAGHALELRAENGVEEQIAGETCF